jgi:hypothetical protein
MVRGLGTSLAALAVGFVAGSPATADPLLRDFAVCAGRFSALVEHQWLVDGPASDRSARQRDAMLSLVEAVLPPDMAAASLHWRIEAKAAQTALLSRAHFAGDRDAKARSTQLLQACADLIGQS